MWIKYTLLILLAVRYAAAEEFHEPLDSKKVGFQVRLNPEKVVLNSHLRERKMVYGGSGAEKFEFEVQAGTSRAEMIHELPHSRVIPDLTASLWVWSNRTGVQICLRIVFPKQLDPRTNKPLTTILSGDSLKEERNWSKLKIRTSTQALKNRLHILRGQLGIPIDTKGAYVDQILVRTILGEGITELYLDEVHLDPVVSPEQSKVVQAAATNSEQPVTPPVKIRLDRLEVLGAPAFPRILSYQEESLELVSKLGFNPIWIPDCNDKELLEALRKQGLWAMATPPRPENEQGSFLNANESGLVAFGPEYDQILFWMMGNRLEAKDKKPLAEWREQVLAADRRYHRPLVADVAEEERVYSRIIPILGTSRNPLQSSLGLIQYRDWLLARQNQSRAGSFLWTWIDTEPRPGWSADRRERNETPLTLEPEQIELATWAAISTGIRGIGFWTERPLSSEEEERILILEKLNLELWLIEDWLATGTLLEQAKVVPALDSADRKFVLFKGKENSLRGSKAKTKNRLGVVAPVDNEAQLAREQKEYELLEEQVQAAVIRTDAGLLILPVWYEPNAQFVPGRMSARDVGFRVEGVAETADAWEITGTEIRSIPGKSRIAGGMKITLSMFDTTTMVIVSSDRTIKDRLAQKIERIRPRMSEILLRLAELKMERTRTVNRDLEILGVGRPQAMARLKEAQKLIERARETLEIQDYTSSRTASNSARQLLRIVQRDHWDHAREGMSHPTSNPHLLAFESLPDHWRLLEKLGDSSQPKPIEMLSMGNFEDPVSLIQSGWGHEQNLLPGIRASVEISPTARRGKFGLRLDARPELGKDAPLIVERPPLLVTTPPIKVNRGDIIHVSGWIRIPSPLKGSQDGLSIHDNILGVEAGILENTSTDWKPFQLVRVASSDAPFTVSFQLHGLGEVHIDDLEITLHPSKPGGLLTKHRSGPFDSYRR